MEYSSRNYSENYLKDVNSPNCQEAANIYLRRVKLEDVNETYLKWMNDPQVIDCLESKFKPRTLDDLKRFVSEIIENEDFAFFAIVYRKGDKHLGNIKLGPINKIHRSADLGIMIGEKDYWGRGIGTNAIRIISKYAFEDLRLHKLSAGCYSTNIGSIKAFLKAGFTKEGVRKQQVLHNGKFEDVVLFGCISPLWLQTS